jgi:hypothetical protein
VPNSINTRPHRLNFTAITRHPEFLHFETQLATAVSGRFYPDAYFASQRESRNLTIETLGEWLTEQAKLIRCR